MPPDSTDSSDENGRAIRSLTLETKVAPGLLVSMPHLHDPHFARAVVLMVEHSPEGSFGLIVNQPGDMNVADLLGHLNIPWGGDPSAVVWSGGPVTPSIGWVLHEPTEVAPATIDGSVSVTDSITLSTSPEVLAALAQAPPARVRFLLGYAGWGPGQLAAEMVRGSWLHADALPAIVFDTPANQMWSEALQSIGVNPETLVPSQGVH